MRQPEIYTTGEIKNWSVTTLNNDGHWIPARPEPSNRRTFIWRWHLAWLVLTGKCDALGWGVGR